jgi:hypothetical protein
VSVKLDRHDAGVSWVVREAMSRAGHALADDDGRVWLIDPVEDPEALEAVAELGEVAGVIQLLDRHPRDCAALAERFGVPHHKLPRALPGTPLQVVRVMGLPLWKEIALWWPQHRALVVADAIGTSPYYALDGPAGVHFLLRALPPRRLGRYEPEHLLVGHGRPVHDDATGALRHALSRSRRDIPRLLAALPGLGHAARRRSPK